MRVVFVLATVFWVSSCATVFRGNSEMISFTSEPPGGEVRLSSGQYCITPCELDVSRKGDLSVTVEMEGYKPYKSTMPATIDGAAVAGYTTFNLVMLPVINDVVDYNTRANYSRKPNPLHVAFIIAEADDDYAPAPDTANLDTMAEGVTASDASVAETSSSDQVDKTPDTD